MGMNLSTVKCSSSQLEGRSDLWYPLVLALILALPSELPKSTEGPGFFSLVDHVKEETVKLNSPHHHAVTYPGPTSIGDAHILQSDSSLPPCSPALLVPGISRLPCVLLARAAENPSPVLSFVLDDALRSIFDPSRTMVWDLRRRLVTFTDSVGPGNPYTWGLLT
jgi:hypothetical protein